MERFCGAIGQHVKNRRNPYASLDRRARDIARLQLIKLKYGLMSDNAGGEGIVFEDSPCTCI